ncbi:hypothetical protein B0J13DRAFT_556412 [Dactylonectria estremocensis]|uniref:Endosomal spry domain-containing protein n=1 Tax=Dactylonectria estremocensis TaxID=1079267 RepID=A0A9P9EP49_9HYPO|nr:hypothetical protein B0J13DRAFT_556412 [Dactylonectria estremocensis]
MAPTLFTTLRSIVSSSPSAPPSSEALATVSENIAQAHRVLEVRDSSTSNSRHQTSVDPNSGVLDPHDINNVGFFVLFALIGVAFVVTGIWFFFWAKNGGFHVKEHDWDDYKTTVLRRRGPNGTLLSGATASTNLGGGSVYKDVHDVDADNDDGRTVITEATALSGITAGASDIASREKRRRKQEKRDKEREKRGKRTSKRHVGDHGVMDEEAEHEAKQELRNYRHERVARVGGLNKESDASEWDGSTNAGTESNVSSSLLSDRQKTPTTTPTATPTKKSNGPGIRKVYSVADRREERELQREAQRQRSDARRVREAGRSSRRDFSYQRTDQSQSESLMEGYTSVSGSQLTSNTGSDLGTKSYHHPMPELRELERERERNREERRARRAGYRRGRQDDEDEVD